MDQTDLVEHNIITIVYAGYATHLAMLSVTVTQHPENTKIPKSFITDGNPNTYYGQRTLQSICASTNKDNDPWVQLDLKKVYLVLRVRVTIFRYTGSNVDVQVGNSMTNNGNNNHICGNVPFVTSESLQAFW
jgi:hypothetical protein